MKVAIITGVSKGLGESIATLLMESGISVYGISRTGNEKLREVANEAKVEYKHFTCDIGDLRAIQHTMKLIDEQMSELALSKLFIINNAAVLDPINRATEIKNEDLTYHVKVNTIAPMILINSYLRKATEMEVPFVGVTISSGAAEKATFGWSAYCSTKASINMYTKTVALEQEELQTDNKIIAFSPGVMDTEMQAKIRSSSRDAFIDVDTFKGFKENNHLRDANVVANVLVDIITDTSSLVNGKIYSVNDYT